MQNNLKVDLISHDLSSNSLGRTMLLAELIEDFADVKIVGLLRKEQSIWKPQSHNIDRIITIHKNDNNWFKTICNIANHCNGDIIISCKPTLYSLGPGILNKLKQNKPLIVDIDDWELGLIKDTLRETALLKKPSVYARKISTRLCEKLTGISNKKLVSTSFLQKMFGGVIVPHYKDPEFLRPMGDATNIKLELGLPQDKLIVLFLGTPKTHKGLDILSQAFRSLNRSDVALAIFGLNSDDIKLSDSNIRNANQKTGIYFFGQYPVIRLPEILSVADIITVPQSKSHTAQAQLPAKLIDAMCMEKGIVTSDVGDARFLLSPNCGLLSEPGNVNSLAIQINKLLDQPLLRLELAKNARNKAISCYSYKQGKLQMQSIFEDLIS